jgi:hypothetical protein
MRLSGLFAPALLLFFASNAVYSLTLDSCLESARVFLPCEMRFNVQPGDVAKGASAYRDEILGVEFRSPRATTYLMREFSDDGNVLRTRFTPTETGVWHYKITTAIKRLDNQEGTFSVADSAFTGPVGVANLRHWWTTGKKPHLWLAAEAPFLQLPAPAFESWVEARKHDGFTHVRGILLNSAAPLKPFTAMGEPNAAYFMALDDRLLAASNRGLTLDLILADSEITRSVLLTQRDRLEPLLRYLVARYGGLNVTWQGVEKFETIPGSRGLLRDLALLLQKYDSFQHPRSTDARDSSSPLLTDGWMNYLMEASPSPQLGAVEHQFTTQPEIHLVNSTDAGAFRHELWNATTNGEYPSLSYASLQNEANVKAVQVWVHVVSDTRHWELEPYFDVTGARSVGLDEVEYLNYAEKPGIVEINLPRHKYNPVWVNPASGEEIPLKDYRGEVFSRPTPDNAHDWILTVPRDGEKGNLAKYYYFESQDPPVQEVETDASKAPFEMEQPSGDSLSAKQPVAYKIKLTRANRASRVMQYVWWGEVVASGEGARLLGIGSAGTFPPLSAFSADAANLNVRVEAINSNGKAYELDQVFELKP